MEHSFWERREGKDGESSVYEVPRVVLSFSKSPSAPRLAQGVSARDDVMTGFLPV